MALAASPALASGPPALSASEATDIQGVSALLRAQVNPEGLATTFRFEYVDQATFEADQPEGFKEAKSTVQAGLGSGTQEKSAAAAISSLSPDTAYRYRVVAQNTAGTTTGTDGTFTTSHGFGFLPGAEGFDVNASNEDGSPDNRAGSHPYALSTKVNFNLGGEFSGQPGVPFTDGDLRDLHIDLPPGLIENPSALNQCTLEQFHTPRSSPFEASRSGESCPDKSQIGVVAMQTSFGGGSTRYFGVFNLLPPPGAPSQLGFSPFGVPIALTPRIRQADGEYGLSLDLRNLPQALDVYGFEMTLWGTPWLIAHDPQRGNCLNEVEPTSFHGALGTPPPEYKAGTCSTGDPRKGRPKAYLTLPTSCGAPMAFGVRADAWQQPALVSRSSLSHDKKGQPLDLGCGKPAFSVAASGLPTTDRASSATGFDFNLEQNTDGLINTVNEKGLPNPEIAAQSQIKKAVVALPEGMTINPSVGAGLGVCTPASYAAETVSSPAGAGCPNASKIGDFTVQSPLFEQTVKGALFLAQPDNPATTSPGTENPFDSLLALYLVAKDSERGILVKVAGKVSADPSTGQLVASFDNLPQLPYSQLKVHFREGQRSPLATPAACGTYTTRIDLTPWVDPNIVLHDTSSFQIAKGIGGGPCPTGTPPFSPKAQAGTLNSNAGSYTPFYLHLTRTDQEQEITSYSAQLPPGLLGKIAGIPYCPEAAIEAAKTMSGFAEAAHPSCPKASEIGYTFSGFGVGTVLSYAPGGLYLAGPFNGSSFSVVAIDSATVGPFDLGTIVVRSAIKVDPKSAQVSIDSAASDPIPHIIEGIPIHLRDVRVYIDRQNLTLNPTSCDPFSITSTLTGSSAPFSNPKGTSASATDHFQVSNCSSLGFKPRFSLHLGAARHGAHPSLRAVYRPRGGDANIKSAQVTLPPSEFLAQGHIRGVCTNAQLREGTCPPGSVYGHARAFTPLLGEPMQGPIYLRSSPSNLLPGLAVSLHAHGIEILLEGKVDSSHAGIRATFEGLPDAPVTKFVFALNGGRKGILENAKDLCAFPQAAKARLIGQNNRGEALKVRLGVKCKKQKRGH